MLMDGHDPPAEQNTRVTMSETLLLECEAERGGGIASTSSLLSLQNRTRLVANRASIQGHNAYLRGGVATYMLPAPPGTWISGLMCKVYRQWCARDNEECSSIFERCSQLVNMTAVVDHVYQGTRITTACTEITFSQPCDWSVMPQMVGQRIDSLRQGALDRDYPYACMDGYYQPSPDLAYSAAACERCPSFSTTRSLAPPS